MKPIRIQRRRSRGWKMPENTVYVGRPGKWGNPWGNYDTFEMYARIFAEKISDFETVQKWNKDPSCFDDYQRQVRRVFNMVRDIRELRGKNLACWCKNNERCHADVLLRIANP